jgi:hypothetical protein
MNRRRRLWDRFRNSSDRKDYDRYKDCRNACTALKRRNRETYESNLAVSSSKNPKRLFAYIKRRSKASNGIPPLRILDSDEMAEDDWNKAQVLAEQYASVFVCSEGDPPVSNITSPAILEDLQFDVEEVYNLLRNLDPHSTPGPDELHPLLLKSLAVVIAPAVYDIFRRSLDQGRIPKAWKEAVVTPVHKGGPRTDPSNYRPISLTSSVCKVMEKIVKKGLQQYFESQGLLSAAQHGFRRNKSTISNLLLARENWALALDHGVRLDVIYVDFCKAFDKVPHDYLLHKLKAYGIQGRIWNWIADFLDNRHLRVKVNGVLSSPVAATSGVPQGSVLGPELFKIYVSDLPEGIQANSLMYADDMKVWAEVTSVDQANNLQQSLDALHEWSIRWKMPVNPSKCSVLPIGSTTLSHSYTLGGNLLTVSEVERDLGILVSSNLKSTDDTRRKVAAATRMLCAIRRAFSGFPATVFRTLFCSHVRPILEYGQPAVFPLSKGETDLLEKVQRRGTRWVSGFRALPYEERLRRLKLFPLEYRRRRGDLIYTRRILNGDMGVQLRSFFTLNNQFPTRGHHMKLFKPRRLRLKPNFTLSTRVINDWNVLSPAVIGAQSERGFKDLMDRQLWWEAGSQVP